MATNPRRLHPDPDSTPGGADKGDGRSLGDDARDNDPNSVQTQQSTNDRNRAARELRQDVMPDLTQVDGGTPNPT